MWKHESVLSAKHISVYLKPPSIANDGIFIPYANSERFARLSSFHNLTSPLTNELR